METNLTFNKIVKTLFAPGIEELVPDGECYSLPAIGKINGEIVDCFFLYVIVVDNEQTNEIHFEAPTAILKIDTIHQQLLFYDDQCQLHPIEIQEISFIAPDYNEEYKNLYVPVREFAFSTSLTEQQKNMLSSFLDALESKEGKSFMPVYREIVPEFFKWAEQMKIGR